MDVLRLAAFMKMTLHANVLYSEVHVNICHHFFQIEDQNIWPKSHGVAFVLTYEPLRSNVRTCVHALLKKLRSVIFTPPLQHVPGILQVSALLSIVPCVS